LLSYAIGLMYELMSILTEKNKQWQQGKIHYYRPLLLFKSTTIFRVNCEKTVLHMYLVKKF